MFIYAYFNLKWMEHGQHGHRGQSAVQRAEQEQGREIEAVQIQHLSTVVKDVMGFQQLQSHVPLNIVLVIILCEISSWYQ